MTIVLNSFHNQCTSRYHNVIMKVMHGINIDRYKIIFYQVLYIVHLPVFLPVQNTYITAYIAPTSLLPLITAVYSLIVFLSQYTNRYFQGLYTVVISSHMHSQSLLFFE
jgi:hypothetical protein